MAYFNRAVDRIKKDHRCLELLGDSKKITAYGEETWNKWRRARPIAWVELGAPRPLIVAAIDMIAARHIGKTGKGMSIS